MKRLLQYGKNLLNVYIPDSSLFQKCVHSLYRCAWRLNTFGIIYLLVESVAAENSAAPSNSLMDFDSPPEDLRVTDFAGMGLTVLCSLLSLYFAHSNAKKINETYQNYSKTLETDKDLIHSDSIKTALCYCYDVFSDSIQLTGTNAMASLGKLVLVVLPLPIFTSFMFTITIPRAIKVFFISRFHQYLTQPFLSKSRNFSSILEDFSERADKFKIFLQEVHFIESALLIYTMCFPDSYFSWKYIKVHVNLAMIFFIALISKINDSMEFRSFLIITRDKIAKIPSLQDKLIVFQEAVDIADQNRNFAVFKLTDGFTPNFPLTREIWLAELSWFIALNFPGNVIHLDLKEGVVNFFPFDAVISLSIYFSRPKFITDLWREFPLRIEALRLKLEKVERVIEKFNDFFIKNMGIRLAFSFSFIRKEDEETEVIIQFDLSHFDDEEVKSKMSDVFKNTPFKILNHGNSGFILQILPPKTEVDFAIQEIKKKILSILPKKVSPSEKKGESPRLEYNIVSVYQTNQITYFRKKNRKKIKLESAPASNENKRLDGIFSAPSQIPESESVPIYFGDYGTYVPNNRQCGIRRLPGWPNVFVTVDPKLEPELNALESAGPAIMQWFKGLDDEKVQAPPTLLWTKECFNGKKIFCKIRVGRGEYRIFSTLCVRNVSMFLPQILYVFNFCEILHNHTTFGTKPKQMQTLELTEQGPPAFERSPLSYS